MSLVPAGATTRLLGALAAVLALVLAGCGGGGDEQGSGGSAPAPGFPVTIPHAFGQTTVPTKPTRVVTVGYNDADFALALGTVPVGVRDFIGAFDETTRPWAQQALNGARPEMVGGNEIDIEKVASLQPDLILGVYSYMDRATYDRLSQIAPTVADPVENVAAPWQEQTRITARALGVPERGEQVVGDVERRFADARTANPQFAGKNIAVALVASGEYNLLGRDDARTQVFTGLGLGVQETTETLSTEQLGRLDQQGVAVLGVPPQVALSNPLFANLGAVRANRVAFLGDEASPVAGALGFSSPLSLPYALDQITPELARVYGTT
ncbi:ABC transporter substrate-binding protein [Actinomycetospora sp. NBRC 106375]|uniref:iron-siderophore ABC transporter substrate-binding protein n=1 Tax=Actinomycetospora sp. NBRC 106375 TaxID=3032207 RepID=UPI0024A3D6B4|nr:iron-siderophore ABC transporter substrate-binding protein [Actinomycetospora sp. NBRC 106375]GLZ47946.1 ABC transporter substrate-binding protein [Actinomycetospora sp. NBRC 106375]